MEEGPFTACMVAPGLLAVCGGIHISDNFEVLNENDEPIPGPVRHRQLRRRHLRRATTRSTSRATATGAASSQGKCLGEQLAGVYQEI